MPPLSIAPAILESVHVPDTPAVVVQETAEADQTHANTDSSVALDAVMDHKQNASEIDEPITAADTEDLKTEQPTEEARLAEMRSKLLESKRLKVQQRVVEGEEVTSEETAENTEAPHLEPSMAPAVEEQDTHPSDSAELAGSSPMQIEAPTELPTFGIGRGKLSAPSVAGAGTGFIAPQLLGQAGSLFKSSKAEATETVNPSSDKPKDDATDDVKAMSNQTATMSSVLSAVS